jgi:tRNA-specific 2-thiouridylase
MRVLVAMSGGVDSSVAAALLVEQGHEVVGATLKLWGGPSDSGCCSVADVDDARRVAQQLGIDHHVFNLTEEFDRHVVTPYVEAHVQGRTPNPCIECNRSHQVRPAAGAVRPPRLRPPGHRPPRPGDRDGDPFRLRRGADADKDQSYVLSMLGQDQLARVVFPVGEMTKAEVRAHAAGWACARRPSPTARTSASSGASRAGRGSWRPDGVPPGRRWSNGAGEAVGTVDAVELVTVGQRRGMGHGTDGPAATWWRSTCRPAGSRSGAPPR